jgi:hypothetical protein
VDAVWTTVSRTGHSHAESMCAWPTALMRCALALADAAQTPANASRAAGALAAAINRELVIPACRERLSRVLGEARSQQPNQDAVWRRAALHSLVASISHFNGSC